MSANSFPRSIRLALLDLQSAPQTCPAVLQKVLKLSVDLNAFFRLALQCRVSVLVVLAL